jgi:antitoxin VapB
MPLFIRDETVDALAEQLKRATNAPSKKAAVKAALENELKRARRKKPLKDRLAEAMAIADAMGPTDPDFDMKKFTDEMWDDL